jgi:hypothetical protein
MKEKSKLSSRAHLAQSEPTWFDKLTPWKKDALCVGILLAILWFLCFRIITEDMAFADSGDTATHQAWVHAIDYLQNKDHSYPMWIPYLFSGMPVFGALILPLNVSFVNQYLIQLPLRLLFLNVEQSPLIVHFFLAGLFVYLFARTLKFSQVPSLLAALTMMMNPLMIELPQVGHGSKLATISYLPLVLLLVYQLFQKRNIFYVGLLAVSIGTMLLCDHVQIAFYGLFVIGVFLLYEIILDFKAKQPGVAVKKTLLFAAAVVLGIAISAYVYLPTQEYSKYSIRGGSGEGGAPAGLNYDYATGWSFHPAEMLNYVVPSTFGFSDQLYWGWMPFTTSTVYVGILPLFLSILALIYTRNRMTIFLAILSGIMLLISFGKYSPFFYDLMFNYFPFFNKFRVPVMILHLMPITMGLMAAYGMGFLLDLPGVQKEVNVPLLKKRLTIFGAVIAGLLVLGLIANSALYSILSDFMFSRPEEKRYAAAAINQLKQQRFDLFWGDYVKFSIFACGILGVIIAYLGGKLKKGMLSLALLAILVIDLGIMDTHYINPTPKTALDEQLTPDQAIATLQTLADTSMFRVLPVGLYENNVLMYHHLQSAQGYSPAKLQIYQEIRDSCLDKGSMNVVNMLNVKYVLVERQQQDGSIQRTIQQNPSCLPRAWFVDEYSVMNNKKAIFGQLNSHNWDPRRNAILEKEPAVKPGKPDSNSIAITSYTADRIELTAYTSKPALMVLSEIYYPAGWSATIDGSEAEIYKTNYILRSVVVPEGRHTIVFSFYPKMYDLGLKVTEGAWAIAFVLIAAGAWQLPVIRNRFKKRTL